jgi:DNA-binding response OmpR family regulator
MHKITIVEDDLKIRNEINIFLNKNGLACFIIDNFENPLNDILKNPSDLILLDLNLPGVDGHYLCKEIRKLSQVPIIVLTSQNTDLDELMSINYGADDFISKPFNPQILLARITRILKRLNHNSDKLSYGGLVLNTASGTLDYGDESMELTKNEMKILHVLMSSPGKIILRDTLIESLWQESAFIDDNTLTVNVNRLRKKLSEIGLEDFLKTKRGQGYML